MLVLLDTNNQQWQQAADELGGGVEVGQFHTPQSRRQHRGGKWGADCAGFTKFDAQLYRNMLRRMEPHRHECLFIVPPDAPFSARRTLELFNHWKAELRGWPRAYVTQDGQEDHPIPWGEVKAMFIGGTDEHKDGPEGFACARAAIAMDKWLHFGRVNGIERVKRIVETFGHYPKLSIDGSGISQYSHMRVKLGRAIRGEDDQPVLEFEPVTA